MSATPPRRPRAGADEAHAAAPRRKPQLAPELQASLGGSGARVDLPRPTAAPARAVQTNVTPMLLAAAVQAATQVLTLERPADRALSQFLREHAALGSRDRAFVAETVYALLRRKRLIEHLAPQSGPRALVLAALVLVRGMNLRELERAAKPKELEQLTSLKAVDRDALPLPVRCDFPDWVLARLGETYDADELLALCDALNRPAPLDLRGNTLRNTRDEVLAALESSGIEGAATPWSPTGVRLRGHPALARHALFLAGAIEVQDEGSQLIAWLVAPRRGEMVVDFCAGAGGKTLALGALMRSTGRLYAFDVAEHRLAELKPRLARSGLANVHPQRIASENDVRVKRLAGKIDRVLVDAPCSGLGTARRNPDLKWRQQPEDVARMADEQYSILAAASRLPRPGGRLVYATCSLLAEENEAVVERFLAAHPGYALRDAHATLAESRIEVPRLARRSDAYLRLLPHVHGTDGFFAAVLERKPER
jgi:16S rRNA (cytosine967-C5)-methyltransferase